MPVVPLVVRQAQQDVKIGDLLVPKNTIFITHFLAMHTSERYWERPLDFIPVSAAMLCLASRCCLHLKLHLCTLMIQQLTSRANFNDFCLPNLVLCTPPWQLLILGLVQMLLGNAMASIGWLPACVNSEAAALQQSTRLTRYAALCRRGGWTPTASISARLTPRPPMCPSAQQTFFGRTGWPRARRAPWA